MLKQCLGNIGEGLLHAGISSLYFFQFFKSFTKTAKENNIWL
jgi:hypothetical protein